MSQSGKTSAEPRLENKRERRRGAAGRAAVLRRAPSDSDCSGETASLSADSGDRLPRHIPPPTRTANARSRRRGSEWEVLEGLKDGQRFDKRPDVFNGYLHKKRKWPLKGWHKRFFVVDGGILVYARSPGDVSRGRLHGSVDVGLSVISAKARRRRIDIDADEFIYHLRAKTPDVFRTWLNVLKGHRLYRQHLLTFGARESLPKIQAPIDEIPPTENSSRTSCTSNENVSDASTDKSNTEGKTLKSNFIAKMYKDQFPLNLWESQLTQNDELPMNYESIEQRIFDLKFENKVFPNQCSLCSMKCVSRRIIKGLKTKKSNESSTNDEKQIISTDLSPMNLNKTLNKEMTVDLKKYQKYSTPTTFMTREKLPTTTCFFFTRKREDTDSVSNMKKSKKCTNLVKYKNMADEPPLRQPSSKCMLLAKYNTKSPIKTNTLKYKDNATKSRRTEELILNRVNTASQNVMTAKDFDKITENLMNQIFKIRKEPGSSDNIKCCIDKVVKDLYDVKVDLGVHPVKALFRSLLEYWMRNTTVPEYKEAMTNSKSVNRQSNNFFCKDQNVSAQPVDVIEKETQCQKNSGVINKVKNSKTDNNKNVSKQPNRVVKNVKKVPPQSQSPKRDTESFEKERRIQELERLLKNTVYVCETRHNSFFVDKDIQITKTLLDHLDSNSMNDNNYMSEQKEHSSSSSEIPKIQETINNLLQDTSLPPGVAKEFLGAYLDVLLNYKSESNPSSRSSDWSSHSKGPPKVEVLTEAVVKRQSKGVSPVNKSTNPPENTTDEAQQIYLKDIINKVTSIFTKNTENKGDSHVVDVKDTNSTASIIKDVPKDELGRRVNKITKNNLICEKCDDNSLVVDLSKYDLKEITMLQDPKVKDLVSITIKLKEKPQNIGESKQTRMTLKLSDDSKNTETSERNKVDYWMSCLDTAHNDSMNLFTKATKLPMKQMHDYTENNDLIDLKPYSSDTRSNRDYNESDSSISIESNDSKNKVVIEMNDDDPQCYMMTSFKKCSLGSTFQPKKKVRLKNDFDNEIIMNAAEDLPEANLSSINIANKPEELTVFEKPAPRIIDEKFILLLLENLTLLSKNVPTVFKDINNLYAKLKKKHEKVIKNAANIQGLSLLGKIYNEELCPNGNFSRGIQYESDIMPETDSLKVCKEVATDTKKLANDKCVFTDVTKQASFEIQTKLEDFYPVNHANDKFVKEKASTSKNKVVTETETSRVDYADKAISTSYWGNHITKEICGYEPEHCNYGRCLVRPVKREITDRKIYSAKIKQDILNQMSILYPIEKVSAQSQTDKNIKFGLEKRLDKDFKVYQMYESSKYGVRETSSVNLTERSDDLKTLYRCSSEPSYESGLISPTTPPIRGPQAGFVSGTPGGRLAGWIIESGGPLENASRELGQAQLSVQQLQRLLDALELQQQVHHDTDVSLEGASPNVKKDRRKFGLRKKKSSTKCASIDLAPPHIDSSASHIALSALTAPPSPGGGASSVPNSAASLPIACAAARPQSLPGAESLSTAPGPASLTSLTPDHQLREDFTVLAKDLVASLKGIVSTLVCERGRLRAAMEAADTTSTPGGPVVAALRTNLSSALQQNSELRSRLSRIHDASDIAEICSVGNNSDPATRQFQQSLSYSSSCVSASEFFDAEEHEDDLKNDDVIAADEAGVIELDGDSSSEAGSLSSGEEGSASSDNSDGAMVSAEAVTLRAEGAEAAGWRRRTRLPAPRPVAGGPSLWNLLYKNIGKDLSQISMPVTINEPLNMLQRLCEELEYCELLDAASRAGGAAERAALVAAFAVSSYAAAAHRAASKPFNPLLAETYECVREDKGFRFLAEQVSHHPPISACHAESPRWCFWQEARIKTKFWGKSMEFQPTGRVHVRLNTTGDHYTWNKVTTCVHNLFGGQRWVDQYGDMHIACLGTDISCKLSFIKASSWSHSRHEVRGCVSAGGTRVRLAGTWSEALTAGDPPAARTLWRPGAMPPEHELYYGFTRFAMELNEMEPGMVDILPHTDTRFRPDQRALENGDVDLAETLKHALEQAQRERRRDQPHHTPAWFRKTIENGEETWVFSGEYWKARDNGFPDNTAPRIW